MKTTFGCKYFAWEINVQRRRICCVLFSADTFEFFSICSLLKFWQLDSVQLSCIASFEIKFKFSPSCITLSVELRDCRILVKFNRFIDFICDSIQFTICPLWNLDRWILKAFLVANVFFNCRHRRKFYVTEEGTKLKCVWNKYFLKADWLMHVNEQLAYLQAYSL